MIGILALNIGVVEDVDMGKSGDWWGEVSSHAYMNRYYKTFETRGSVGSSGWGRADLDTNEV